jgi:hypothetical protein
MTNVFYTYAYLREDGTPYYIGKGKGKRAYHPHNRHAKCPPPERILFLKKNLTEEEAIKHEIYLIAVLGRKDLGKGILHNFTDGGEGASGLIRTEEWKKAHSERMSGEKNPQYGKTGEKSHSYGSTHTEEWKQTQSERMSGRTGVLHHNSKAVIAIKPDGTELNFGSTREASRELGIDQSDLNNKYLKIGNVLKKGKFEGWRFVYKNP